MNKRNILTITLTVMISSVLLVGLSACGAKEVDDSTVIFEKIESEAAIKLMAENTDYRLIDVRTKEEYDEGHIKGAELMPLDALEALAKEELVDLNQTLIIYCRSGNRSGQASNLLKNLGYTKIYDLGGIIDWTGDIEK